MKFWKYAERIFLISALLLGTVILVLTLIKLPSAQSEPEWIIGEHIPDFSADVREQMFESWFEEKLWPSDEELLPIQGPIEITDRSFYRQYELLHDRRPEYLDREIMLSGYVLNDDMESGRFLVGRDLLWCCGDDMYFVGFLVQLEDPISVPDEGSSVSIRGFLKETVWKNPDNGQHLTVPVIMAETLTPSDVFSRIVVPY